MLSVFFKRREGQKNLQSTVAQHSVARLGKDLIASPQRVVLVTKIKRLFSVTEAVWLNHYLYAIEQFAELVQEVPASEIHHHSTKGGLLDHTLEAVYAGMRIAQGYVLPPNSEPEHIAVASDRWRFGAFIAILAHDIGKIVTDIEIVYRERGGEFQPWHPWYAYIPIGAEYRYRYKERATHSKIAKSLHEKAAMSLLPRLLTRKAAQWIFEDTELLAQLFSTVTHATFGGQAIAEIVRTADSTSVAKNLGADTGIRSGHSMAIPLHEKLIVSLRKLINDGDLKRNKPGAAIWVTETDTWVVSKATMEAVRAQLLNEGHRGIPKNVVRLFEVLREHQLLIPNPEGDSVWTAEINDFAKNWQQKLTFLRFQNEIIWPTSHPDSFDGDISPLDGQGNKIMENKPDKEAPVRGEGAQKAINCPENNHPEKSSSEAKTIQRDDSKIGTKKYQANIDKTLPVSSLVPLSLDQSGVEEGSSLPVDQQKPQANSYKPGIRSNKPEPDCKSHHDGITSNEARHLWKNPQKGQQKAQEDSLLQNEFIAWLLKGIARRNIRVNEAKAPVHILEHHIALVTPAIFNLYMDKNSLKKRLYEKRAGNKKIYTLLQRELETLDIHQRGSNGQNIVTMLVEGQRSQSELKVYLLNRDCFPSLSNFQPNKAMKIQI